MIQTSNEFPEIRVNVDSAGQVSSEIGDGQRRVVVCEKYLELANVAIYLDERIHISRRRNHGTYSVITALSRNQLESAQGWIATP